MKVLRFAFSALPPSPLLPSLPLSSLGGDLTILLLFFSSLAHTDSFGALEQADKQNSSSINTHAPVSVHSHEHTELVSTREDKHVPPPPFPHFFLENYFVH